METGYTIKEIMTKKPICAGPDDSIEDVAKLMAKHDIGSVIIKKGVELEGLVTHVDMVNKAMAKGLDVARIPVSKIMTSDDKIIIMSPDADMFRAIEKMNEHNIRHIPIVHKGKLAGLVTTKDILRVQPDMCKFLISGLDNQ